MANPLIVVTGATGNIGSKLAAQLLGKEVRVRAVARNASKLKSLADKGAEVVSVDLKNLDQTTKAFQGADAVFAMIPPDYSAPNMRAYQNSVGEVLAEAIQKAGVRFVVNLSSYGAHLPTGTGPILGLRDQEARMNKLSGVNIIHLRPSYFMENLLMNVALIRDHGIIGSPMKSDAATPMIATQDIAAVAADYLVKRDFTGTTVRELLGPKDVTMKEVATILGAAVGKKDLPYVQFPYDEAEKAMLGMGMSADSAREMVELGKSVNEGHLKAENPRTAQTNTPTTLGEFAKVFAKIYNAAS